MRSVKLGGWLGEAGFLVVVAAMLAACGGDDTTQSSSGTLLPPVTTAPPPATYDVCPNVPGPETRTAVMIDCDSDGILNRYDGTPYGETGSPPASAGSAMPCPMDPGDLDHDGLRTCDYWYDTGGRSSSDDDGDGLFNSQDPHPQTYDWDNDGRPDGADPEIEYDERRAAEERLEQQRLEEEWAQRRQEEQRLEEQRERQRQEEQRREEDRQRWGSIR